jgi:hypothetical protein
VLRSGDFPTEMLWSVLVLIPKGSGGFRGIGLLEVAWKVVSAIINARLKAEIEFHDSLHVFRVERGTATATIEAKLLMQNACVQRKALYEIFIDLVMAYDKLYLGRTLEVLKGYDRGLRVLLLLDNFWNNQAVVARKGGYHRKDFKAGFGVTQGDILSPMISDIVVDCVIRAWELDISDGSSLPDEAFHSLVAAFHSLVAAILYADDGLIASYQPELGPDSLDYLVELFQRMGLNTNTLKTKSLTCSPRSAKGHISIQAYKHSMDGDDPTHRDRQRRRSEFPVFQKGMLAGYLHINLRQVHGSHAPSMESPKNLTSIGNPVSCFYSVRCPGRACSQGHLRRHFMFKHPQDWLVIQEEGPLPRCGECDMFVTHSALAGGHHSTVLCRQGTGLKQKRAIKKDTRKAREVIFTVVGVPIDSERWFVFLGRLLSTDEDDWPVVLRNMVNAWQRWAYISWILRREGSTPRISAMFYKAVLQTVLIFGSEPWVLTPSMLGKIEGFHRQIARRFTGHACLPQERGHMTIPAPGKCNGRSWLLFHGLVYNSS